MSAELDEIAALIARVASSDQLAFKKLYSATSAKLFGVALRILHSRQDAEEVLQDVYIKVWAKAPSYQRTHCSPMSWLIAIARNRSIDMLRQRNPASEDIDGALQVAGNGPDPEAQAISAERNLFMHGQIATLDADKATLVRDAYLDGLSYAELAARHAMPMNTVRTHLRRSLHSMAMAVVVPMKISLPRITLTALPSPAAVNLR